MEDRYDISVDIGEGKDYSVATLLRVDESGKCIYSLCGLRGEWERLSEALDKTIEAWTKFVFSCEIMRGKRRKTTYKTIRRDCAKRNRYK